MQAMKAGRKNNMVKLRRVFIAIAGNVDGLLLCWYFIKSSRQPKPIEKLLMKITTNADRITSAGYGLIAIRR
jgi:hypothetical protein